MGKLMKLYDGEFDVSVGDGLIVIGDRGPRFQTVTKVGNVYVTVRPYGREVRFKDGISNDLCFTRFLCSSMESYNEEKRKRQG